MTYRDEGDALRAKVETLEAKLEAADAKIAALTGEKGSPETEQFEEKNAITGTTSRTLARTLPFEIDAEGYEAIARLVRERLGVEVAQVGHSLTTSKDVFSLRREDGRTTIRMTAEWRAAAQGVVIAGVLTGIFATFGSFGVLHDVGLHHPQLAISMLHTLWLAPAFVAPTVWLARRRARRFVDDGARLQQSTLETVVALAEKHRVQPTIADTRVAEPSEEDEEEAEPSAAEHGSRS